MKLRKYREKLGFVRFYSLLLIIIGFIFYAGFAFANMNQANLQAQNRVLNKSLGNVSNENERLQSQYNVLKVELDIAQLTQEHAKQSIQDSVEREQTLKEQILFYQRVMAPEMTQDGFLVQRMEILPTLSERNYAIKMVLLQHENIKAVIKGELAMQIHGSAHGKPVSFSIDALQDEPKIPLAFAFKYFQVIDTSITLPEGFMPERLDINTDVYKYRKKRGSYTTTIKWQEAFSEAQSILD